MLKLALGNGRRSLAVTKLDTSVFEMLVSESNKRKASSRFLCQGHIFACPLHCPSLFPPVGGTQIFKKNR